VGLARKDKCQAARPIPLARAGKFFLAGGIFATWRLKKGGPQVATYVQKKGDREAVPYVHKVEDCGRRPSLKGGKTAAMHIVSQRAGVAGHK
jgi:hypothetical protein